MGNVTSNSVDIIIEENPEAAVYILNITHPDGTSEIAQYTRDAVVDGMIIHTFDNLDNGTAYPVSLSIVTYDMELLDAGSVIANTLAG